MNTRKKKREEQHEAILSSACTMFAKFGFRKTTVEDIARGAGLRKASVYYYYKSKEEVFSAVVNRESHELLAIMKMAAEAADTTHDKFRAFFLARYKYFKEKRNLYAVSQTAVEELRPFIAKVRDEFMEPEIDALSAIIDGGISAGEIEIADSRLFSLVAVASLQGIDITFWRSGWDDEIENGLNLMIDIFFKGVSIDSVK